VTPAEFVHQVTPRVVYQPQPGPQTWLLECPVKDLFFGGARGGGKTYGLMGDWLAHAGRYGKHARGIWFRRSMPELRDVLVKMRTIFEPLGATYHKTEKEWHFPNGAVLILAYLESDADAARYQGWEINWMGVDEAGTWPSPEPLDMISGSARSVHGVPIMKRLTGNPGGPGHGWLKKRYIDPAPPCTPFIDEHGIERVFIPSKVTDNRILMLADPTYVTEQLVAATIGKPHLRKAWIDGDWNAQPDGAMLEVLWTTHRFRMPHDPGELARFIASMERITASLDPAEKPGVTHDYSAGSIWGLREARHYLLHAWRGRWAFPELRRETKAIAVRWNPSRFLVEDASSGVQLIQDLQVDRDWRWPLIPCKPDGPKPVRFSRTLGFWESGLVLLPEPAPHCAWIVPWLDEHKLFPLQEGPGVDDWCDASSQYLEDAHLHRGDSVLARLAGRRA
jgi:predicted phage terminase large subunit-like protein